MKILLTRPFAQAAQTAKMLLDAGIESCSFAVQRMDGQLPPALHATTTAIFADKTPIDGFIFISANAVEFGWPWVDHLPMRALYSVGAATTAALREQIGQKAGGRIAEYTEIIQPESQFDSEGLLAVPQLAEVSGQRLVIIRGLGLTPGRDLLATTLRTRGARVDDAFCYIRTVETPDNRASATIATIQAQLKSGEISMVNVQSGETLRAFEILFAPAMAQRENLRLLVPHHRIAALAVKNGYKCVEVTGVGDNCLKSYLSIEASHGKRPQH